jgi:hypothetical protein
MKASELREYVKTAQLPTEVRLDDATLIVDVPLFVMSHLGALASPTMSKRHKSNFYERLLKFVMIVKEEKGEITITKETTIEETNSIVSSETIEDNEFKGIENVANDSVMQPNENFEIEDTPEPEPPKPPPVIETPKPSPPPPNKENNQGSLF